MALGGSLNLSEVQSVTDGTTALVALVRAALASRTGMGMTPPHIQGWLKTLCDRLEAAEAAAEAEDKAYDGMKAEYEAAIEWRIGLAIAAEARAEAFRVESERLRDDGNHNAIVAIKERQRADKAEEDARAGWAAAEFHCAKNDGRLAERDATIKRAKEAEAQVSLWRSDPLGGMAAVDHWKTKAEALETRVSELLALVAKISQETPLPDEVAQALTQRGAMLAEIGTLRARVAELEAKVR